MNTWQPIETAPKDGTDIIVYRPNGKPNGYIPQIGVDYWGTFSGYETWAKSSYAKQPTHWMPFPAPPIFPATQAL